MIGGWLWDRNISDAGARKILKNPSDRKFARFAATLLSRVDSPKKVFKDYLDPLTFCKHWNNIKREMRKNKWDEPRIVYWQAIYEALSDKYRRKGIIFRKEVPQIKEPLCRDTGRRIREIRQAQGLSQNKFAGKINVSQQLISRIEKGRENVSLSTLANIARALGMKVDINFIRGGVG